MDKENIVFHSVKPRKDLSGKRFGKLLAIKPVGSSNDGTVYAAKCDCGKGVFVRQRHLVRGHVRSCGCLRSKLSHTPEYTAWAGIKKRCLNQNVKNYKNYGGRGINICDRWKESFENFLKDMGPKPFPKAQIDRVDNDKGYSPENCRWVSASKNNRNKRNNRVIEFNGETKTFIEWAEEYGIHKGTFFSRLNRQGWSMRRALMP